MKTKREPQSTNLRCNLMKLKFYYFLNLYIVKNYKYNNYVNVISMTGIYADRESVN